MRQADYSHSHNSCRSSKGHGERAMVKGNGVTSSSPFAWSLRLDIRSSGAGVTLIAAIVTVFLLFAPTPFTAFYRGTSAAL